MIHLAFCCLVSVFTVVDTPTSSWPRFRGPNGSGQGIGFHWPTTWNDSAIQWKVELPGEGHGSPVIHAQRIYLQSASKDGRERVVFCLDSQTGKKIWQQSISGHKTAMHKKNSLASGSAATDGEVVAFCHWDGEVMSLAAYACADGKPLWSIPLGKYESQHGPGHSPIVHHGKVIVLFDSDTVAEVFCVDAKTGSRLWTQPRTVYRASYSTPLIRQGEHGEEIIVASTAGVTAYDLESGKVQWHWTWPFAKTPLRAVSSPVLCSNELLLAACGDGGGDRDTVALTLPGAAREHAEPSLLWQLRRDVPYVTCLLQHQQHVYYVADKGVAGCLELKTGKDAWQQRLNGNFTSSPLLIDGRIVVINEDGDLFVFAADPKKYQPIGKLRLQEQVYATPALADGCLYVRGLHHLFCLGAGK
jgi:outer membrane protein assembly factor BamB